MLHAVGPTLCVAVSGASWQVLGMCNSPALQGFSLGHLGHAAIHIALLCHPLTEHHRLPLLILQIEQYSVSASNCQSGLQ